MEDLTDSQRCWVEDYPQWTGDACAVYQRVSSPNQRLYGSSSEAQLAENRKTLEAKVKPRRAYFFVDEGLTGRRFDNRQINQILALQEAGEISQLVVTSIDRLGRDSAELILFFLQFCKAGGTIRAGDQIYSARDLASLLVFIITSYSSEHDNTSRTKAMIRAKIFKFKLKKWNKGKVPPGYVKTKEGWLEKDPLWKDVIPRVFELFMELKDYSMVHKKIKEEFGEQTFKLSRHTIRRILNDPIYCGRPQFLSVKANEEDQEKSRVLDDALAYVSAEVFEKCLAISAVIGKNHRSKDLHALKQLAHAKPELLIKILQEELVLLHRKCGGVVERNGTTSYSGTTQQLLRCEKCKWERRIPTKKQLKKLESAIFCNNCTNEIAEHQQAPTICTRCLSMLQHQPQSKKKQKKLKTMSAEQSLVQFF